METINQKSASNSSTAARLSSIAGGARGLWASELPERAPNRENLIVELLDLELAVERLAIRASCRHDWPEGDEATLACAEQLVSLERRWHEAAASATASRAGSLSGGAWADHAQGEPRS